MPDICRVVLSVPRSRQNEIKPILSDRSFKVTDFECYFNNETLFITTYGKAAHGSVPEKGENACFKAVKIVSEILSATKSKNSYIEFIEKYFTDDTKGTKLGVACADQIIGDLSVNVGICDYDRKKSKNDSGRSQTADKSRGQRHRIKTL